MVEVNYSSYSQIKVKSTFLPLNLCPHSTLKIHHRVKVVLCEKLGEIWGWFSCRTKVLIFQCKHSNTSVHPPASQWAQGFDFTHCQSIFSGPSVQFAGSFNVLPSIQGLNLLLFVLNFSLTFLYSPFSQSNISLTCSKIPITLSKSHTLKCDLEHQAPSIPPWDMVFGSPFSLLYCVSLVLLYRLSSLHCKCTLAYTSILPDIHCGPMACLHQHNAGRGFPAGSSL